MNTHVSVCRDNYSFLPSVVDFCLDYFYSLGVFCPLEELLSCSSELCVPF